MTDRIIEPDALPEEETVLEFSAEPEYPTIDPLQMTRDVTAAEEGATMAASTITTKHERRHLMFFCSLDGGTTWEVLGVDNDDLSKELNPDVEKGKNVLGESTFRHLGYEPEVSVDPYYADPSSSLYDKLLEAAIEEKYDDASIKGKFVEVCYDQYDASTDELSGTGHQRDAYIVPQSTGGDTAGLGIPFTVNPVGPMTDVSVTYKVVAGVRTITIT